MRKEITEEELERRLGKLQQAVPASDGFVTGVLARVKADAIRPAVKNTFPIRRWLVRSAIGIAASVAVAAAAWHFFVGEPRVAYGIDDLPQRMLALKSLHLKGTIYEMGGAGQPLEMWAQRPNHVRVNGHRNEGDNATGSSNEIISPEARTTIDEAHKSVVITSEQPVDAELDTERVLQEMQVLLTPEQRGLVKVRQEMIGGVKADIYESRQTMPGRSIRAEVALNPADGLPLRSSLFMAPEGGKEVLMLLFDVIEPNGSIPAETFIFRPPADYRVSHADPVAAMSRAGMMACGTKYAIPINNQAVLLCWARYDTEHPGDDLNFGAGGEGVDFLNAKGKPYHEHLLRADGTPAGFHWRWSLMTLEQPDVEFGRALSLQLHAGKSRTTNTLTPVPLPPEELAHLVEEAQRTTLPEGGKPMTLEEIRGAGGK